MKNKEWTGGRVILYAAVIIIMLITSVVWIPVIFLFIVAVVSNILVFIATFIDAFTVSLADNWQRLVYLYIPVVLVTVLSVWLWRTR